jgi:hypothetical protein
MPNSQPPITQVFSADPSSLTTAQLLRENMHLRELLETGIEGHKAQVEARFAENDKAIKLLAEYPTEVTKEIGHLKELIFAELKVHAEKFNGIDGLFKENKANVTTAFEANKTTLDKIEQSAIRQIDQLRDVNITLGNRVTAVENIKRGMTDTIGWIVGAAGLALAAFVAFSK